LTAIFSAKESDFYEMLLHHLCAMSLLFLMMFSNYIGIGCIVLFAHLIAELFVCQTKFWSCTEYENVTLTAFLGVVSVWIYTRTGVLTYISSLVWCEVWNNGGCRDPLFPEIDLVAKACGVMLTVLSGL
jgi:ceramide synthetase